VVHLDRDRHDQLSLWIHQHRPEVLVQVDQVSRCVELLFCNVKRIQVLSRFCGWDHDNLQQCVEAGRATILALTYHPWWEGSNRLSRKRLSRKRGILGWQHGAANGSNERLGKKRDFGVP